ncbi:MAG: 3'-5' exonuclease [Bacteroidota bacterium]|nr:3'-5' exonuclease [Bacteroidota bacterium]
MNKKITKDEVNEFPLGSFEGDVEVIEDVDAAIKAIDALKRETIIGIDTETKPAFQKGEYHDPSLVQLSGGDKAYLFRIKKTGLLPGILELLSDPKIMKVGLALPRDIKELQEMHYFEPANMVDLNIYCPKIGFESIGVRNLAALVLGFRISKRYRISNWETEILSMGQIRYAATDAWVCREIYLKLQEEL